MTEAKKWNVLLVDDDKFLIDMYSMKFTAGNYNVQACLSVTDALGVIKGGFCADAIVFDILMPEQDGFAFLQTISKEGLAKGATLIALTNQSDDSEKTKAEGLGVDRYIIKASMIPSEVVALVEGEIAKKNKACAG
ncbi:MAG: response regulator [Patescibacteria group bacterium]